MSTSTASSSVSSFYTSNGVTRLNGSEFASGLDTQKLIAALTANTTAKINKQKQLEQKADWKRDMFHEIEDLIQKFSDTYFSYSTNSSTNIMSKAFFDSEDLISSNSSIVTATGAASDAGNVVIDKILNLASAATYTGQTVSKTSIDSTQAIGSTITSGSYLNLDVNGKTYTLSLGANIDTTGKSAGDVASALTTQLNTQAALLNKSIKDATSTESTVAFSSDDSGKITLTGATVTGASANFGKGLGTAVTTNGVTTYDMSAMKVTDGSIAELDSLSDQLAGTTLTVQLDGLSKSITFNQSESDQYNTTDKLKTYLQSKMDTAFGKDLSGNSKVKVDMTNDKLSITTPTDATSVLQFSSSSSSGILDMDGLLHIRSGETNRLELDKTLDELNQSNELQVPLSSTYTIKDKDNKDVTAYKFTVNGKEFTFDKNTELNTVINTINNDTTANVTVSYSQTLNQFRIVSDDTGLQGKVSISDSTGGGNLAAALFGIDTEPVVTSKALSPDSNGKFTDGNYSYTFALGDGTSQEVHFTVDSTNDTSLSALQTSINNAISSSSLNGKVTVGVSDGKFTFQSTGATLKITAANASQDILGMGTSGTASVSGLDSGKDLTMGVTLGGTEQTITRSTNSFTLDGVTLNVSGTTKDGDSPIKFSASNNVDDLYKKISTFVDEYNKIIDKINTDVTTMPAGAVTDNTSSSTSKTYEPLTDDQKKTMTDTEIAEWNTKAKQGLLFSDPQVSALQTDIRNAMESGVDSVGTSLASIGISTKAYDSTSGGKLVIDDGALKEALKSDPDKVAQLFTNSDGIATRVKDVINKNIGEYGNSGTLVDVAGSSTLIGADNSELGNAITAYEKRISDLNDQLKTEQDRLQTKFTEMETIISKLSDQYNYISNMSS
jgi:flagellar capping protein FliD